MMDFPTGIGSGIMRAMHSYDKISFKNDFVREEFITTLKREELPDEMVIHQDNEGINASLEGINESNEDIKLNIEGINEGINEDLEKIVSFLKDKQLAKHSDIKSIISKSNATIERYLKILRDNGIIEYIGAKKTGGYRIKL
jgi:ATP-dependent DNA helicase RecG